MNNKLNIKLNELNASELDRNEKQKIRGGDLALDCCGCGCCYEGDPGGSSSSDNTAENSSNGFYSPDCGNPMVCTTVFTPENGATPLDTCAPQ